MNRNTCLLLISTSYTQIESFHVYSAKVIHLNIKPILSIVTLSKGSEKVSRYENNNIKLNIFKHEKFHKKLYAPYFGQISLYKLVAVPGMPVANLLTYSFRKRTS